MLAITLFITGLCKAHQKIHTGTDNRKYSCKVCNKMFVSKSYLQTHLRIHTGEKPFMCEVNFSIFVLCYCSIFAAHFIGVWKRFLNQSRSSNTFHHAHGRKIVHM